MTSEVPKEEEPKEWEHFPLWQRVKGALDELPVYFEANISISGISATDIYTLGGLIGAAIEDNLVSVLNRMRSIWDRDGNYAKYEFKRQPETFPDVLLRHVSTGEILMGIELKGWYLLSKEREPSFRFRVTPSACAPQDLLVIVPWALENVLSGNPQVFKPFVASAEYAAKYRNYWWQNKRDTNDDTRIEMPENARTYPRGREAIEDKPVYDKGNNFGRIARTEIMDKFVKDCHSIRLAGIEVNRWHKFLKGG